MNSVSELTEQIKSLLETTFLQVSVSGEVSRPTYHSSGHLYFTLKDDKSSISCVMFKGNNQRLKFRVEEGMEVSVYGGITLYAPRGSYQINCSNLEPKGSGALTLAYEQLKKKLHENGYFNQKRPLPTFPKHIALVTSKTGAALQDMLNVASKRYPLVKISLCNTLVQGEEAKYEIANAIKKAQSLKPDIMIISRGGGSMEDLWAFNEEIVAKSIYESSVPTVSAIGHAIDTLISDFVADATAPTPSAAMEMVLPDINELRQSLDMMESELKNRLFNQISNAKSSLLSLQNQLHLLSPKTRLNNLEEQLKTHKKALNIALSQKFFAFKNQLNAFELTLKGKNPQNLVQNGYAQLVKDGKITTIDKLKINDEVELQSPSKILVAKIIEEKS